ncbi:enoyl-CoA hydratase/isomerase family protein [Mycolicibacterium goodii]|uniref:3-hydroxyisobutyryl-CoA hydrolase n=1 Tax=Mycolicibacterium goodii TaxID=134601 RepID=A0A0K0X8U7_MYCGD|nr:hypothetical protein AFA91_20150 [Mycolicibacterium goodii]
MTTGRTSSTQPALSVVGRLGTIALRRPAAINAITPEDIARITELLGEAVADSRVTTILLHGEGDRGFCAGGDIKRVRDLVTNDDHDSLADFWSSEYRLDHLISTCPKPIVSIAHGLTLGGGMGLASHAAYRVVTDSSRLGMPEVFIGLSPDIGGLWLYANAPGCTGRYAALTGTQLSAGDALYMKLADHYVPQNDLPAVIAELSEKEPEHVLAPYGDHPPSWVADHRAAIDAIFGGTSVREISKIAAQIAAERSESVGAVEVAENTTRSFADASPTALAVTFEALDRASRMSSLGECLMQDLVVSQRCSRHPDLTEGIRARVVDKDRSPQWNPPTLDEVTRDAVAGFFDPIGPRLALPTWPS